jgi:hypothetical protein
MMRKLLITVAAIILLSSNRAAAADFSSLAQIPVMLNLIILIGAAACFGVAIKLLGLVRGGALARGWQMFVVSFITLAVGQVFVLAEKLGFFVITFDVAGIMYSATVALWFMGLFQTRKVLG